MGIDVWEVLDAASTKPFGFMRFNPGPGWGGHCIPLDPFYLALEGARVRRPPRGSSSCAGEVNVRMPHYVVQAPARAERARQGAMKGTQGPDPRRGLQEGHRRPAREPCVRGDRDSCAGSARRAALPRPARAQAAADAHLAASAGPVVRSPSTRTRSRATTRSWSVTDFTPWSTTIWCFELTPP